MLSIHVKNIGEIAIVQCEGRIVRSEAALKLREAVTSQRDARIIVLDLSGVTAIEGGGLGMFWFLLRWAEEHNTCLKLLRPTASITDRLRRANGMFRFDVITSAEMMLPSP